MEGRMEWKKPEVTEFGISKNTELGGGTSFDGGISSYTSSSSSSS